MKYILASIGLNLVMSCTSTAQDSFTVKVKMPNPNNYKMLIAYPDGDKYTLDTSYTVENGFTIFKGKVSNPALASFVVRNPKNIISVGQGFIPGPQLNFVARNGATIIIKGDAEKSHLATVESEDKETKAYEVFRAKDKYWNDQEWELLKKEHQSTSGDADAAKINNGLSSSILKKKRGEWSKNFVKKYPDTYAALEVFATYALDLTDQEQAEQFAALPDTYKTTNLGKIISDKIQGTANSAIGVAAIPFSQVGHDGKTVDLSALKGKVVLLDFWGSWCVPCRQSFPHLKELYSKYKELGFEVVGIASEKGDVQTQSRLWNGAIKEDGLPWLNILNDSKKNDIVKQYGVVVFPTQILLDRDGVVQGRFSGTGNTEFEAKLEQLLKSSNETHGRAQPGKTSPASRD